MNNDTTTTEPPEAGEAHEPSETAAEDRASGPRRRRDPDSEAAARRHALRDAEAARDALAARVETYQRRDVERLAAKRLAAPGDVWDIGHLTLTDVLTEDGDVDEQAVTTAVEALLKLRPGLAAPGPKYPDMAAGRRGPTQPTPATWADVIRR